MAKRRKLVDLERWELHRLVIDLAKALGEDWTDATVTLPADRDAGGGRDETAMGSDPEHGEADARDEEGPPRGQGGNAYTHSDLSEDFRLVRRHLVAIRSRLTEIYATLKFFGRGAYIIPGIMTGVYCLAAISELPGPNSLWLVMVDWILSILLGIIWPITLPGLIYFGVVA
jgi:hypothetical protein